eukprot:Skav218639  [mRNA]  locus=scaffold365:321363:324973:- [translate_table: standard]
MKRSSLFQVARLKAEVERLKAGDSGDVGSLLHWLRRQWDTVPNAALSEILRVRHWWTDVGIDLKRHQELVVIPDTDPMTMPAAVAAMRFLAFLVVFGACILPCAAQDEGNQENVEEEAIDFSIANEGSITSTEEVVSGVILIYGEIDTDFLSSGDIDIVVKETLGKVCKNFERPTGAPTLLKMFVDVRTVGQRRIGMNYSWQILPPIEAGKDCINRLAMVGFGPKEPPFDKYPAPPIRQLLTQELKAHPPTRLLNTTDWTISVQNMSCDARKVIKHWNHSRSIDVFPTEEPECLGPDSVTWEPNLEGEFDLAEVGNCNTAGSNACVCAALPSCEWVPQANGISTCVNTAIPGVPCQACSLQEQCVLTPERLCASKSTPCACVLAQGGCNWNMARAQCELSPTESTPCIACPRQYFCSTPSIRHKSPQNLAIMGTEETGWFINITFDRQMEFMHIGIGSGVLIQCRPKRPGDWPPTFEVDYKNLEIDGVMLQINVFGLPNDESRDCDVVISDTAVRGLDALLPFNGLPDNELFITVPDGLAPQVNSFIPANSAISVPIDPMVRFFFDEKIKFLRESMIQVYSLGGNRSDREADVLIAEINVWSSKAVIDQDTLLVDLSGILSTASYYSVVVPPGAVADLSNNPFGGIPRGVYMFQTGADERVGVLEDTTKDDALVQTIIIIVAGCLVGIVALAAAYMACEQVRKVRRRARVVARKDPVDIQVEEVDVEKPQLPHLSRADDDDWPVQHFPTSPSSPTSPTSPASLSPVRRASSEKIRMGSSSSLRRNSSEKIKGGSPFAAKSPTGRPNVQIFSKPEELKTQAGCVHTQLRNAGNVVSLADYHNKSSQMMRTIGGKVDDRKRRPGAATAPSSPVARRHSALPQGVPRLVEGNPRRLQSAEGLRPSRSFKSDGSPAREGWPENLDGDN